MHTLVKEVQTPETPDTLLRRLRAEKGLVVLRSGLRESGGARYSFVTAGPFLRFSSAGSRCETLSAQGSRVLFGDPWLVLDQLLSRFELLDEIDLPFPLGGCFGFWGYDLKHHLERRLSRRALNDLELPDCHLGFYDSVVVFDHALEKAWIISTGLAADGSRDRTRANQRLAYWQGILASDSQASDLETQPGRSREVGNARTARITSGFTRAQFVAAVARAKEYIRAGDIYQVNLAQRLEFKEQLAGISLFERLASVSPAPYSAFFDCESYQLVSSSPELFLRMSGGQILTRPIKGTRPRSADPVRDAQLTYELQTSAKEMAELVMITDLLRNDLGRVCEYGSVQVPDLVRLEKYPQVQHLVSTIEGRLRPAVTHAEALAACFPGGSITGAPKIRAMEIIDELEPVTRGPYTGCHGYLGFNRESQLSISIRTAVVLPDRVTFHAGAGIVADSVPEMEYEETLAKARGFLEALEVAWPEDITSARTSCSGAPVPARDSGTATRRSSA